MVLETDFRFMRPSAEARRSGLGALPSSSGSRGASNSASVADPPRSLTPTRTGPMFSSSTMIASCSPLTTGFRSSASKAAVPTVGCPANGISAAGVKMRMRAECAGPSGFITKTVSDRLNSRAMVCIVAVSSASASRTTASGLPPKRLVVNTSRVWKDNRILHASCRPPAGTLPQFADEANDPVRGRCCAHGCMAFSLWATATCAQANSISQAS